MAHFCQLPRRALACSSERCKESNHAQLVRGVRAEDLHKYLAQLAGLRDGDQNKDTH